MASLIEQIDLNNHGVIEASAGTGKTYTIENLIPRILLEKNIKPQELLIVTFTEKATGELKERVRDNLKKQLESNSLTKEEYGKIEDAYQNFESIEINTIHGFCNKLLSEYSFEAGRNFESSIVDDIELFPGILRKIMKKEWLEIYGEHLETILKLSPFESNPENFETLIVKIANSYNPDAGDTLNPLPDPAKTIEYVSTIEENISDLKKLINYNGENIKEHKLYLSYSSSKAVSRINDKIKAVIDPLLTAFTHDDLLVALKSMLKKGSSSAKYKQDGYSYIFTDVKKSNSSQEVIDLYPGLDKITLILDELNILYNKIASSFIADNVELLQNKLEIFKEDNNMISFNDMIKLAHRSIKNNLRLKNILQNRYKLAIVDEFQDTDKLQWEIFKTVFTERSGNLLYVVGDPKQAIYGFRGADVEVYLHAKKTLLNEYNGKFYNLSTNYRTEKKTG